MVGIGVGIESLAAYCVEVLYGVKPVENGGNVLFVCEVVDGIHSWYD